MSRGQLLRALLLPALAVLVPSVFITVLATQWMSLERDAAKLRGAQAAEAALTRLRIELQRAIASQPPPAGLVRDAVSLDPDGRFVQDRGNDTKTPGRPDVPARAATLLSGAVESIQRGEFANAAKASRTILACCADERDEFGVSYAVYASWQLAAVSRRWPDVTRQSIVDALRAVADRGGLDEPIDQTGVRALVDALPGVSGASSLVSAVDQQVSRTELQRHAGQLAQDWVRSLDPPPNASLVLAPWRSPGGTATIAAFLRTAAASRVVILDHQALNTWIADWTDRESSFTFVVRPTGVSDTSESGHTAPLFVETPAWVVRARQTTSDPTTDRQRGGLFMAAAAAVVLLTIVAGGLAVRDVVRERRLAALRATFLAGVTHEIKTPITSMRLLAETLQHGRVKPEQTNELLGTIVNEAEHLSDLVDGLLSTSRIESGARTYQKRVFSLSAAVQSARRRCAYMLEKEGFTLVEEGMNTAVFVNADSEALQQAVLNLLGNAMKYSGDSRVIRLSIDVDDSLARVQVADSGIGVPERERSRIFTSFYRSAAVPAETTGTGLGLALVRHFAEAHGGKVSVESRPAGGSVFSIELPRCLEPSPRSVHVLGSAESARHG